MSAGLISRSSIQHDFRDDLESSIYVLLWTILMYSRVGNRDIVPAFLSGTLDPAAYKNNGGVSKKDFLKGRSFLEEVCFTVSPLDTLIYSLAELFAVRYEDPPSEEARNMLKPLLDHKYMDAYNQTKPGMYDKRIDALKNHDATIRLFEKALEDRTAWPTEDSGQLQLFDKKKTPHLPITKTSWYSGIYVQPVQLVRDEAIQHDGVVEGTDET